MDNQKYRELMYHMSYIESMLEVVADKVDSPETGGGGRQCPICGANFHVYLPFGESIRKNAQCPKCGSLERHRALWFVMQKINWCHPNMRVLHFAPEQIFYAVFSSLKDIEYWPVDLNPRAFGIKKVVDITNITFEDNYFDLIMCTHVLEHIPDDKKAMQELYRVLKPQTGIAFLTVPIFNFPKTLEDPNINTPELRSKYYGQFDHVRAYGLDYPKRLESVNFNVQVQTVNFNDKKDLKKFGINPNEEIFLCRKIIDNND